MDFFWEIFGHHVLDIKWKFKTYTRYSYVGVHRTLIL